MILFIFKKRITEIITRTITMVSKTYDTVVLKLINSTLIIPAYKLTNIINKSYVFLILSNELQKY